MRTFFCLFHLERNDNRDVLVQQVVVPEPARKDVMYQFHEGPWGAHYQGRKAYLSLKQNYWWPSMKNNFSTYCESCEQCQTAASSNKHKSAIVPLIANNVSDIVECDLIGPFPITKDGHKYILTMMDHFSRWFG